MKRVYEPLKVEAEEVFNVKPYKFEILENSDGEQFKITQGENTVVIDAIFTFDKMLHYVRKSFVAPNEYDSKGNWFYKYVTPPVESQLELMLNNGQPYWDLKTSEVRKLKSLASWISDEIFSSLRVFEDPKIDKIRIAGAAINTADRIVGTGNLSDEANVSCHQIPKSEDVGFIYITDFYFKDKKSGKYFIIKHTSELDEQDF